MEFYDFSPEEINACLLPPVKLEKSNDYTNIECNLSINIECHEKFNLSKTERLGNFLSVMGGSYSTNNNGVWLLFKYRNNHHYKQNLLSLLCFISKKFLKANGFAVVKMYIGNGMMDNRTPVYIDYMTYGNKMDTLRFLNSLYKANW